jgi:cobalt-precorrin 5A hydrolase
LGTSYQTWDAARLGEMDALLSTRSDYIFNTVGVYGVAESAALYAAREKTGQTPELVLNKHKTAKATCAIARSYQAEP